MRILLVEDDQMLGEALQAGLGQAGYLTDWLLDGLEALEACYANAYEGVILDINLPGMSGLEVLRDLRRRSRDYHDGARRRRGQN